MTLSIAIALGALLFLGAILHTDRKRRWQRRDAMQEASIRHLRNRLNENARELQNALKLRNEAFAEARELRGELAELRATKHAPLGCHRDGCDYNVG